MYRNCVYLSKQFKQALYPKCHQQVLIHYENYITKRWAGHSKWQNIKATKTQMDLAKASLISKFCKKISMAVKEEGSDPKTNAKLRNLLEEAKKLSIPNSSLQNAIKLAAERKGNPQWLVYGGPNGAMIAVEVVVSHINEATSKLAGQAKKALFTLEKRSADFITEKGYVTGTVPDNIKNENAYDKAVEDALEAGVVEVIENEDKTLVFECFPTQVNTVQKKLEDKGYNIESAQTEVTFTGYIEFNEQQTTSFNNFVEKANLNDFVIRIYCNDLNQSH